MRLHALLCSAMLLPCLAAHADTINTYALDATLSNGGAIHGTVSIDVSDIFASTFVGTIVSNGQTFMNASLGSSFGYGGGDTGLGFESNQQVQTGSFTLPAYFLALALPVTYGNLSTFAGGLGTDQNPIYDQYGAEVSQFQADPDYNEYDLATGTLTRNTAVTPEPSALILFGTGLLGACAVGRGRIRRGAETRRLTVQALGCGVESGASSNALV